MENVEKNSKKAILAEGIIKQNPIFVMLLGICPTLAVTSKFSDAFGMSIAFALVLIITNVLISLVRKLVPTEIRIPVYIVIIASTVTIVEMLINAFAFSIAQSLGLFLPLIVVNCIILGRAEAFASKHNPLESLLDAISMAAGFALAILVVSFCRELLSTGGIVFRNPLDGTVVFDSKEWFISQGYVDYLRNPGKYLASSGGVVPAIPALVQFRNRIILPIFGEATGAFLTLGFLIAGINAFQGRKEKKNKTKEEEEKKNAVASKGVSA